jgi:hypothetical protein
MTQTLNQTQDNENNFGFFQQYAADCLKKQNREVSESLRRRQIPPQKIGRVEESSKISLILGDDISLKPIKKSVLKQIDAAASFIRDFQIGVLGQRTSIFHLYEIEIQIERNIKYLFSFESGKLLIQLPYWQVSFLNRNLSSQEMKIHWHRGEHLPKGSPARRVWWLFNPIGEFRSNLRTMLLLAVQKQILGIDQLFIKFGLADADDNPMPVKDGTGETESFKNSAIAFLKQTVNEDKLGINLEVVLKNQNEATLVQLLGLFKKNLADPGQMEELIDAGTLTLQEVIHEEQSQVGIKMFGFVNVGNYHRIDVALNLSSGYLKKYVELVPRKAEVKATLFGFVNVYTIDDITVKPNFHGAMKLNFEAAALERALRELQLVG